MCLNLIIAYLTPGLLVAKPIFPSGGGRQGWEGRRGFGDCYIIIGLLCGPRPDPMPEAGTDREEKEKEEEHLVPSPMCPSVEATDSFILILCNVALGSYVGQQINSHF